MQLFPIDRDGAPRGYDGPYDDDVRNVLASTKQLYATAGFREPWISYLAVANSAPVGTCSFKSPPVDGRVEIAYYTFAKYEGQGFATAMAAALVAIAEEDPEPVVVAAQTLPQRGASHRVLEKVGFRPVREVDDVDDGVVLEWHVSEDADP